jgi:HlyD family secretion protein
MMVMAALRRRLMKKKFKLGLILALVCLSLVGLTACGGGGPEVQRQLIEVTRGDILLVVTAEGNLSLPWHRELTFGTSGTVAEINVEEGDSVTKGQLLASLDVTTLELAVRNAEIDLESAQNSFAQLTTPYPFKTFAFALPESLGAVRAAQSYIEKAREELVLGLEGEPYDMAEMKEMLRQAQESLDEAESKLATGLGEGIVPSQTYWTIRAAQIAVDKAQLALDEADNNLEKAVILAPFDGVIAKVNVKEGDKLSSMYYATTIIIELIDPTIMEMTAELDEIDIPDVKLNQRAIIEVDALPDLQLEGKVTYINPVSIEEAGVVLYEVTVGLDVPPGSGLMGGMSATADIVLDGRSQVLLVPDRAIAYDSQGNPVVKVMVDEQVQEKAVVVGMSDGYQTEIIGGLHEGETVIIEREVAPEEPGGFLFGS